MDPFLLTLLLVGFLLGGLVTRSARFGGGGYWAAGWAALFAAGIAEALDTPQIALTHLFSMIFCGFMLAGALDRAKRQVPRFLLPGVTLAALAQAASVPLGWQTAGDVFSLAIEPSLLAASALVIHRASLPPGAPIGLRLMPLGFLALAGVQFADTVAGFFGVETLWILWIPTVVPVIAMQLIGMLEEGRDRVTLSKKALEESLERVAAITKSTYDLIAEVDLEGSFHYASPSYAVVLGYQPEELLGTNIMDLVHPDVAEQADRARVELYAPGGVSRFPARVRHKNGSWRWMESTASGFLTRRGEERIVLISRDVTERIEMEEQLRASQKLESLGLVAGGVAHDFNNLLAVILGNASLARAVQEPESEVWDQLGDVEEAAESASKLTQQLLAYAGGGHLEFEPTDLSALIDETAGLLEGALPADVQIERQLDPSLPAIDGDSSSLSQVIMNLITNAVDAMDGPGLVRVDARAVDADKAVLARFGTGQVLEPGRFVRLEVRDTGCGMDESTSARMFDPFFSTKGPGRGLGLASLLGIVRGHGGALNVETAPGEGTTVEVLLPATKRLSVVSGIARPSLGDRRGSGTVLVVDDEEAVSRVARRALEARGFRVLLTSNGAEGVEVFERNPEDVVAVILDLSMPVMGGAATLSALKKRRPTIPVILTSGFGRKEAEEQAAGVPFEAFLQKPCRADGLIEVVFEALDQARPE